MAAMAAMGVLAEVSTREARSLSMSMPDTGSMHPFTLPIGSSHRGPSPSLMQGGGGNVNNYAGRGPVAAAAGEGPGGGGAGAGAAVGYTGGRPPMHHLGMPVSPGVSIPGAALSLHVPIQHAYQHMASLKMQRQLARPRAMSYTEGDAFVSFQAPLRPRSNTLSDEDAVGALLSFGGGSQGRRDNVLEKTSGFVPSGTACVPQQRHGAAALVRLHNGSAALLDVIADAAYGSNAGSTQAYMPHRERALSDMSEAAMRLGKLDMVSPGRGRGGGRRRRVSSPLGQSAPQEGFNAPGKFHGGSDSLNGSSSKGDEAAPKPNHRQYLQRRPQLAKIGIYSPNARKERLRRFMEKRKKRIWRKRVKYDVRKNFADSRLRFKGRFVKKEDEELMRAAMEIC